MEEGVCLSQEHFHPLLPLNAKSAVLTSSSVTLTQLLWSVETQTWSRCCRSLRLTDYETAFQRDNVEKNPAAVWGSFSCIWNDSLTKSGKINKCSLSVLQWRFLLCLLFIQDVCEMAAVEVNQHFGFWIFLFLHYK